MSTCCNKNHAKSTKNIMKEIKDTLNLPQTDFPMKANLSQREPAILDFWAQKTVYQTLRKMRHGQKKFMLNYCNY